MKTKTWILLLLAVLLLCAGLSVPMLLPREDAAFAEIYSDGRLVHTAALSMDRTFTIDNASGRNVVTVKGGKIAVTEANCPDRYCMDRGFCAGGPQIVCLPNRLVIQFVGEQAIDGIVG